MHPELQALSTINSTLKTFLSVELTPASRQSLRCSADPRSVHSPYAGAVLADHAARVVSSSAGQRLQFQVHTLIIGTLNPGRSGLTLLGTDTVRLWNIAEVLSALGICVCVIPGAS